MDIDNPTKDSYQLRQAGARQTLIACQQVLGINDKNTKKFQPRFSLFSQ